MKDKRIHVTLPQSTKEALEQEAIKTGLSISTLVALSLQQWLDHGASSPLKNRVPAIVSSPIKYGGSVPIDRDKVIIQDKEIQEVSLSSDIKPGPGAVNRLSEIGVKALDVIKAKRAKNAGRAYDKSLEQYFHLL